MAHASMMCAMSSSLNLSCRTTLRAGKVPFRTRSVSQSSLSQPISWQTSARLCVCGAVGQVGNPLLKDSVVGILNGCVDSLD